MRESARGQGPQPEEERDERSRRRRLLAILGRIRRRVEQVCGVVDDVNGLIDQASDIASDIRSVLESPEFRSLLPADAQSRLDAAASRLEQVQRLLADAGERARIPADVCADAIEALDIAEAALQGPSQWGRIADRLVERFNALAFVQRLLLSLFGAALVVLAGFGIWNVIDGSDPGAADDEVFGVYMLPPAFTLGVGETLDLGVRVEAEGGIDVSERVSITWSVDDDSIGAISGDGVLEGLQPGPVGVTVEAAGLSDFAVFTVEGEGGSLPDLVVELNDPVFVDCVGGLCTHSVLAVVRNNGDADAGSFILTVELDGTLTAEARSAGLPGGEAAEIEVTFDPSDTSCYNPNCTAVATVDSSNLVDESVEDNNMAEELFVG